MFARALLASLVLAGLALVSGLVYLVWFFDAPRSDVSWAVSSVVPVDETTIRVTFVVDKPADREAECQVAAFTAAGLSAGRLDKIVVPARTDGRRTTELTVIVPTDEEEEAPTKAQVAQCVLVGGSGG